MNCIRIEYDGIAVQLPLDNHVGNYEGLETELVDVARRAVSMVLGQWGTPYDYSGSEGPLNEAERILNS